ncbi:CcdC protein domain-containing protein [Sphingomonas bacterium]|uniref:CcdC protein domain-containing protein n=1 Tax=Sphingomonas bacterium TaxID=1895847 RepID=UPI00262168CB|nr:CcdC protein domain-containing protein [Sphingomonas bacterium]MDB5677908.1 hypothetical protein [Sphingomonas bacterium]
MNPQIALLLTVAIPLALVIALFVTTGAEKPLTLWQLAITPTVAIATIGVCLVLQQHPPFGVPAVVGMAAPGAVGLMTGTLRAGTVRMRVDPVTGALLTQTSSYAFILFAALFGIRFVGAWTRGHEATSLALFDAALLFALAMIVTQRLGIFRRARTLLRAEAPLA